MGARLLDCRGRPLSLEHARVMGILNITPDSFSDGGRLARGTVSLDDVCRIAQDMVDAGAAILDVGGESTRPGAAPVSVDEELDRVIPVVARLAALDTIISVDTRKAAVAAAALDAGCHMINDVSGLADPAMLDVVAGSGAALCVMHMQGSPETMQRDPQYEDVVAEVRSVLGDCVARARRAGMADDRLCVDPGFGFGKTLAHNLALFTGLEDLRIDGLPILVGVSRKRMIGDLTGAPVRGRLAGSVAAAVLAAERGADIVRVHDVAETADALKVLEAVRA
ncbi:MAG: dihydropteroate synthase [Pseudomonadales bacterium]